MQIRNLSRVMLQEISKKCRSLKIDLSKYGYSKNTIKEIVLVNKSDSSILSINKEKYNLKF